MSSDTKECTNLRHQKCTILPRLSDIIAIVILDVFPFESVALTSVSEHIGRGHNRSVPDAYILAAISYFVIYMFLFAFGIVFLTLTENVDLVTAMSASIATLSNIGPGLGKVGAMENYAWISGPGKVMLSFLMLAGRLELFSILVLLVPATWKK